jgi:predicted porin
MKLPISLHVVAAVAGSWWLSQPGFAQSPLPPAPPPPPDAPSPLIEIYGTLVPYLEYAAATGSTAPGHTGGASQVGAAAYTGLDVRARPVLDVGTSNIGFRGGIELTDDLAVTWQVESGLQFDGTPVANTIGSRNSSIGLTGSWGTAFVGSWDTPYKWSAVTSVNPIRAGFISDYNGILSGPGFGVATVQTQQGRVNGAADAAFERRIGNSLQYWSPTYQGVFVRLAYSLFEGRTPDTGAVPSIKPSIFSGAIGYDRGPLKLRYAFELHRDYFGMTPQGGSMADTPTNRHATDLGHRFIASYTNPQPGFETRAVGVFEYLSYDNDDTNAVGIKSHARPAYYLLVDQTLMAKHHVYAAFGQALPGSCSFVPGVTTSCTTEGLGANMVALGYVYRLSKDTDFYAAGYRITNDASASFSTFPPLGAPPAPAPGADVQGIGIGMLYQFSAPIVRGQRRGARPTAPPPAAPPVPAPATTPDVAPGPTLLPAPADNPVPVPVPKPQT